MTNQVWMGTAMFAATAVVAAAQPASDTDARIAALEAQRAEIDARIDAIKSDRRPWLSPEQAEEVRALVREALADAQTRASYLQDAATVGYDGGFFIRSADGNYLLRIGGRIQFRWIYGHQDNAPDDGDRAGFEVRRTKLEFGGHLFDPAWTYRITGTLSRSTGVYTLDDSYFGYRINDTFALRAGQFRPGFMREDMVSSARLGMVEKSLVNSRFAQGRVQGVEFLVNAGENVKLSASFNDGIRTLNTAWQTRQTEYAFTGRAEALLAGNWRQFREYVSWSDEEFALLIGGGAHWQKSEFGTDDPETEFLRWTVDGSVKFGGANLFAAFVGDHFDVSDGPQDDQYGLVVQGGLFLVPDKFELAARYEWGETPGAEELSIATVGFNYYLHKHNLKWSTDVGYGFNPVAAAWASTSAGWRADAPDEDGQVVVRSQVQIAF